MKKLKIICVAVCLFITAVFLAGISVQAAESPAYIDLAYARKNESGEGYYWDNRADTLTLDGLDVSTELDYGLRLPEKCTVVLNGKNRIKAGKYGIGCFSDVTFKGNGELTVEAGDTAIYVYSGNANHKILIREGTFTLKGSRYGIQSSTASVSITDGVLSISAGEQAITAPTLSVVGGKLMADSPLYASHKLEISGAALDIRANGAALLSDGNLITDQVKMYVGDDGKEANEYGGESVLKTVPALEDKRGSIIFGKNVSSAYDWLVLAAAVLLIAAVIGIPIARKKIKTKRLYERLAAGEKGSAEAPDKKKKGR